MQNSILNLENDTKHLKDSNVTVAFRLYTDGHTSPYVKFLAKLKELRKSWIICQAKKE